MLLSDCVSQMCFYETVIHLPQVKEIATIA